MWISSLAETLQRKQDQMCPMKMFQQWAIRDVACSFYYNKCLELTLHTPPTASVSVERSFTPGKHPWTNPLTWMARFVHEPGFTTMSGIWQWRGVIFTPVKLEARIRRLLAPSVQVTLKNRANDNIFCHIRHVKLKPIDCRSKKNVEKESRDKEYWVCKLSVVSQVFLGASNDTNVSLNMCLHWSLNSLSRVGCWYKYAEVKL